MAKDSGKKKKRKQKKGDKAPAALADSAAAKSAAQAPDKRSKTKKAVSKARSAASKIAEHPLIAEVVAAALVAAAAAIKDPKKARQLAVAAGDELKDATSKASRKSEQFWNMALDIARRSLDAVSADESKKAPPPSGSKK